MLFSCVEQAEQAEQADPNLMTQQSEELAILHSKNGELSYHFETPLLERYEMAKEPYMEFRRGINMTTFNDSTRTVESTLVANYAIFYEKREIWEVKGDVEVVNVDGDKLETQQLFWNQKNQRIYSNVDSKVTQGEDVMYGTGFESDETFTDFIFRNPKGYVEVDMAPSVPDSLASDSVYMEPKATAEDVEANARAAAAIVGDQEEDEADEVAGVEAEGVSENSENVSESSEESSESYENIGDENATENATESAEVVEDENATDNAESSEDEDQLTEAQN